MDFKVGDRVREIKTGDIGVITKIYGYNLHPHVYNSWWILWETGSCKGQELHLQEDEISHCTVNVEKSPTDLSGSKMTINGITYTLVKD